jgi:hypothetical protein
MKACFAVAFVAFVMLLGSQATAEIRVQGLQTQTVQQVAPNVFEYTAALRVRNSGPATSSTLVTAMTSSPSVRLIDAAVDAGALAANAAVVTSDTIRWQQTGRRAARFAWEIVSETPLTLDGIAKGGATAAAGLSVSAVVSRTNSGSAAQDAGRPVVEQFDGGTTGADGRFSVGIVVLAPQDFVTITLRGASGAVLGSIVGEAGDIIAAGGRRSSVIDDSSLDRLVVTPLSTAAWALALQAHSDGLSAGDAIESEAQWQAAIRVMDNQAMLQRAVFVKVLLDDPSLQRPPGFTDAFELALRDSMADAFRIQLQSLAPARFAAALAELVTALAVPYVASEFPATLHQFEGDPKNGATRSIVRLQLDADGTGAVLTTFDTEQPLTWTVDSAGRVAALVDDQTPVENFPIAPPGYPCGDPAVQVRALSYTHSIGFIRIFSGGRGADVVLAVGQGRTEFVDCPQFPPDIAPVDLFDLFGRTERSAQLAVRELPNQPFATAELTNGSFAAEVVFAGNGGSAAGLSADSLGADVLRLAADGTGRTERTDKPFAWSVDAAGELVIGFDTGEINRFRRLAQVSGVASVLNTVTIGGAERLWRTILAPVDGAPFIVGPDGVGYRSGLGEEQIVFQPGSQSQVNIDYQLRADGTGCRRFVSDSTAPGAQPALWTTTGGRIDFDYYSALPATSTTYAASRYFAPVRFVGPREFNDRSTNGYVVIENLRTSRGVPAFDPATRSGRLNFLRILGPAEGCP